MEYGNIALKKKELGFRDSLIHGEKFGRFVNNNSKCLRTNVSFISSVLTSEDVKQERVVSVWFSLLFFFFKLLECDALIAWFLNHILL